MTESDWTNQLLAVLAKAGLLVTDPAAPGAVGWIVTHDFNSQRQVRGEPDLACTWHWPSCPGRHAWFKAELKQTGKPLSAAQRRMFNALIAAGEVVYLWTVPDDSDLAEWALGLDAGAILGGEVVAVTAPSNGKVAVVCGVELPGVPAPVVAAVQAWAVEAKLADFGPAAREQAVRQEVARLTAAARN